MYTIKGIQKRDWGSTGIDVLSVAFEVVLTK